MSFVETSGQGTREKGFYSFFCLTKKYEINLVKRHISTGFVNVWIQYGDFDPIAQ